MIDDEDLFGSVVLLCTVVFFGLSLIRTTRYMSIASHPANVAKGTTTGRNCNPPLSRNISLYGKKEVVLAVQAVGGTTHFVIVFCFFTSDNHMIMLQIFAV